jgi:uncharacterized lipoprotein YbaY
MRWALLCAFLGLAACGLMREREVIDPSAVRGMARVGRRMSLPPQTVATIQLEDTSIEPTPQLVGEQRIVGVRAVPFQFSVHFDAATIDPRRTYRVLGRVITRDELVYMADPLWVHPIIGDPLLKEMILRPVDTTGAAPAAFRGIAWGSGPPDTIVRASGPSGNGGLEIYRSRLSELPPFLDVPVEDETYSFAGGRCFAGQLRIQGEDSFTTLLDTMTRRYGKPDEPRRDVFVWRWPKDDIEVTLAHAAKWQHTTVTMTNTSIAAARALQAASAIR